jgi:hypothetical protein
MEAASVTPQGPGRKPRRLDPTELGAIAVQLALYFPVWVRRRRFVMSYVDDTTIRQRMSVDFELPDEDWFWPGARPESGCKIYVPLHIAVKETLDRFSVYDEEGRRLTMLATAENGAMAVRGLMVPLDTLAEAREASVSGEPLRGIIDEIVMAGRTSDLDPVKNVFEPKLAGPLGTVLNEEDENKAIVRDLAGGFLMLVPVTYEAGGERLLKAEWELPNYWHGRREAVWRYRLYRRGQTMLASVGWADKRQSIPTIQIGWARSTHVEVVTPPDVRLRSAALHTKQFKTENTTLEAVHTVYNRPSATINTSPLIRYQPGADRTEDDENATRTLLCRDDSGSVELRFRSPPYGVPAAATIACAALTVLLWVASEHLVALDRQTFSAVLLVFPAILAVYLLRPGEHDFARRLLTGVRLCGLGVALLSLVVAAMLGVATLTRAKPTVPGSPAPGSRQVTCTAHSASVSVEKGDRAEALRGLTCSAAPGTAAEVEPNPPARRAIRSLAAGSTLLSGVLLIGFLRTWIWSDLRTRNRPEEYAATARKNWKSIESRA